MAPSQKHHQQPAQRWLLRQNQAMLRKQKRRRQLTLETLPASSVRLMTAWFRYARRRSHNLNFRAVSAYRQACAAGSATVAYAYMLQVVIDSGHEEDHHVSNVKIVLGTVTYGPTPHISSKPAVLRLPSFCYLQCTWFTPAVWFHIWGYRCCVF